MTVGYIGLGRMGRALARHLPAVCDLSVYDLDRAATAELATLGARGAASPRALGAACAVVFLCLPRSADVETVLFGEAGLAETLATGSIVIDQTSGVPGDTRRFAAMLAERGVTLLDAPVAGGVPGALAGTVTIMASGPAAAYDAVLPLLHAISPNVFRCSDRVGDAQALKSVNNIVNAAYRIATLEIVAVGRAMGLSIAALAAGLHDGPGRSFMTARLLPAIAAGRSSTDFALALMVKDLNQAIALGQAVDAAMPLSDLARGIMQAALATLGDAARLDDIVTYMERATGQDFAGAGTAADASAIALLGAALAAVNYAIVLENATMAARAGLDLTAIEPILACGSACSAAAAAAFATARGEGTPGAPLPDPAALTPLPDPSALTALADIASRHGVAMLMTNTVRALALAATATTGP